MSKKPVNSPPVILQPEPQTIDFDDFLDPSDEGLAENKPGNLDGVASSGQGFSKVEPRAEPRESSHLSPNSISENNHQPIHPPTERPPEGPFIAEAFDALSDVGTPPLEPQLSLLSLPADESRVFAESLVAEALDTDTDERDQALYDSDADRRELEQLGVNFCNLLSNLSGAARVPRSLILRDFHELATRILQSGLVAQESRADLFMTLGEVLTMLGAARNLARSAHSLTNIPVEDLARAYGHWCRMPSEQPTPLKRESAPTIAPKAKPATTPDRGVGGRRQGQETSAPALSPGPSKPASAVVAKTPGRPSLPADVRAKREAEKLAAEKKKADAKIAAQKLKDLKKIQADAARAMAQLEKDLKK